MTPKASSYADRSVSIDGIGNVVGHHNTVNVTYQGQPVTIPSPEAVAAHRRALVTHIQTKSQRWGGVAAYIQEEGVTLPIEASPYDAGRMGARESLLPALHAARRLLVLGEPGSGKTVSLQRLAWELCRDAHASIPVSIQLFRYAGRSLGAWVKPALQETGDLWLDSAQALEAFLKAGTNRFVFLLDGLNEVQPAYRDKLVSELVRWMKSYPEHPVILTSRSQDELWRRLRDEVDRVLVVQPVTDEQVCQYLVQHHDLEGRGADLYDQLDERLREMARTPLILWLIKEAGAAGESIPGNRGELYRRFVVRMLRRDTQRRMDAEIPEAHKRVALSALAYHLSVDQRLTCTREEAEKVVADVVGDVAQARMVVGACARHGLLVGDDELWFAPHQTVQEYFAAQALCQRWQLEEEQPALSRWWLRARGRSVLNLAEDDWWAEPFVQLAGLADETDALARGLARVNPWLAWWCVEEGRDVKAATRGVVEDRSIRLLHADDVADRRRAVAALARMQNVRSVPSLIRAAGDADGEVAQVAVRALGEYGKAVWPQIMAASQDRALWLGLVRYVMAYPAPGPCRLLPVDALEVMLGFPVVWVPAGPFLMGSDRKRDLEASANELPQHKVVLPGYWIARMPVTVVQFRAFAAEYRGADRESLQGLDDHPMANISWDDAMAYCRWLREKSGLPVTLPSEAEWEKAARGTDGRIYPWGDEEPTADLCNFGGNVRGTTPVGQYSPRGDSPYGCADMAGNVWEWTRSFWGKDWRKSDYLYPYDPDDGRENLEARGYRVLRGGSFDYYGGGARCAYRGWFDAGIDAGGCRVAVAPFTPVSDL